MVREGKEMIEEPVVNTVAKGRSRRPSSSIAIDTLRCAGGVGATRTEGVSSGAVDDSGTPDWITVGVVAGANVYPEVNGRARSNKVTQKAFIIMGIWVE